MSEDEYDDIDQKAILMDIAAQLDSIRRLLETELHGENNTTDTSEDVNLYRCTVCHTTISESEQKDHAKGCFGWHEGIGDSALNAKYERVIQ